MTVDLVAGRSLAEASAAATTAILLVLGLPAAWWLTTTRWRGKFLIEAVVALPLVLPPTVLGFYLLVAMGPRSPLGRLFEGVTGSRLPFSFTGLLLASVLYSLPFAVQPFAAAFAPGAPATPRGVGHARRLSPLDVSSRRPAALRAGDRPLG